MVVRFASFLILGILLLAAAGNAIPYPAAVPPKEVLRGYLVDLVCMKEEAGKVPDFGLTHTKKCLQMPACSQGGYALLLPSKEVLAFDEHGNTLARKLIAARNQEKAFM